MVPRDPTPPWGAAIVSTAAVFLGPGGRSEQAPGIKTAQRTPALVCRWVLETPPAWCFPSSPPGNGYGETAALQLGIQQSGNLSFGFQASAGLLPHRATALWEALCILKAFGGRSCRPKEFVTCQELKASGWWHRLAAARQALRGYAGSVPSNIRRRWELLMVATAKASKRTRGCEKKYHVWIFLKVS